MKNLKNENGVALLQALMITVVVGISAGFILSQMRLTDNTLIIPRIRSEMLVAESAFRNMAYMSGIYACGNSTIGASSCSPASPTSTPVSATDVADVYLQQFESNLPSCTPAPCGIRYNIGGPRYTYTTYVTTALDVTNGIYPTANMTIYRLNTRIAYGTGPLTQQVAGKKIAVAPVDITVDIPEHIITGAPFLCARQNAALPFFRGFQDNGNPICTGWIGANQTNGRCNPGYFLSSFNADNGTLTCVLLQSTANLVANTCATAAQLIGTISWPAGVNGNMTMTCNARPNAFTYFTYDPFTNVTQN